MPGVNAISSSKSFPRAAFRKSVRPIADVSAASSISNVPAVLTCRTSASFNVVIPMRDQNGPS